MDSDVLGRRGFSLLELSLVFAVAAVLLGVVFYCAGRIRQAASAQRTVNELEAIASVSTQYYLENGAWPGNLSDLRPSYLSPTSSDFNPFGNAYTITPGTSRASVSTRLPKGLVTNNSFGSEVVVENQGNNDLVSVTKSVESANWRLKYEKKYIYHQ